MKNKSFKLFPCILCTIGYNCYVAGHNVTAKGYQSMAKFQNKKPTPEPVKESNSSTEQS